jgi:uncharacterized protein (DUF885 family)
VVAIGDYNDLASLFKEFREFQNPQVINGVPDYSAAAIAEQLRGLKKFQSRLAAIDAGNWPVSKQVDYHLVRAEWCAEIMPRGRSQEDEPMVWYEQQSNLRFPAFHTGCVLGKAQFRQLFRERAMQLGDKFNLRQFIDEFLAAGMIPMSLTRWEMTGYNDEIKKLW